MVGSLRSDQIKTFEDRGCIFPVEVLTPEEAAGFRKAFDAYQADYRRRSALQPPADPEDWLVFPHLRHAWAFDLVTHPRVADAIESILGPDVMIWDAKLFPKPARSTSFVSWHQDATYMPMEPVEQVVTAWIALSHSTAANGAMQISPGSHKLGQQAHVKTFAKQNLLSYGQEIQAPRAAEDIVNVELRPGQMSIHHMHLVHGSPPNPSDRPRIGISINYLTPAVVDRAEKTRPALLLRGCDRYGHFQSFSRPAA